MLRQYIYHPDSVTPVAFVENGQVSVMQADCRGAITHVYDPQGKLVWQGRYSAYGSCEEVVSEVRQPLRLAGQYADAESGLHYNLGRYYAPFVGSYVSLDPQWLDHLDNPPYSYAKTSFAARVSLQKCVILIAHKRLPAHEIRSARRGPPGVRTHRGSGP